MRLSRQLLLVTLALSVAALPAAAQGYRNYNQGSEPEPLSRDPDSDLSSPPSAAPLTAIPAAPSATDTQIRIQNLETQLRNMNGTVENVQFRNQQLEQALQRITADDNVRFQMLEKRIADQEAAAKAAAAAAAATPPADPAAASIVKADTKTDADTPAPEAKTLGTVPRDAAAATKNPAADQDAQSLYDQGFKNVSEAKYDAAEKDFKSFLKAYPKHRLTENAKYWLAESYYARSRFPEAAVAFAETYQEFPSGSKAPDNLLKLAMSLAAMEKKPDACLTLAELKKHFPNASAMIRTRAEQERKLLACAA